MQSALTHGNPAFSLRLNLSEKTIQHNLLILVYYNVVFGLEIKHKILYTKNISCTKNILKQGTTNIFKEDNNGN